MKTKEIYLWDVHYQVKGAPLPGSMNVASTGNIEAMQIAQTHVAKRNKIKKSEVEITAAFVHTTGRGLVTVKS